MKLGNISSNKTILLFLVAIHVPVLFPGFFAPNSYSRQHRDLPYAPPTKIHFIDDAHRFRLRPFVYPWRDTVDVSGNSIYEEDRSQTFPIYFLVSDEFGVGNASRIHLLGVKEPGTLFIFGTDDFGRDEFSRMLYGSRISFFAGLVSTALALVLAVILGLLAGFYGGWIDTLVMRSVDLFLALPWLYLLFAVRAVLPLQVKTTHTFILFIALIGMVGWARPARLLRGLVLTAKERNFVQASRMIGASDLHILWYHILPQIYGTLLTLVALLLPQFILAEITLSFLGLGVGEPMPSLGNLLAELQRFNVLTSYWWMYLPAFAVVFVFLAYHWFAKTLEEKAAGASI